MTHPGFVQLIGGKDENGRTKAIAINSDGSLKSSTSTGGDTTGGRKVAFRKVFSDYTLTANDDFLAVDCTDGAINITLPSAVNPSGTSYPILSPIYEVKKVDYTTNFVNIVTINSETIDDENIFILNNPHESINLVSDGSNWLVY